MQHSKNVQAILDWYRNHMPTEESLFEALLSQSQPGSNKHSAIMEGMVALALHGFEAGREFQKNHPDVEPGVGYAPDAHVVRSRSGADAILRDGTIVDIKTVPREPSKPHPNLSDDINRNIIDSEVNGGVWVTRPYGAKVKDEPFLPVGKGLLVTTQSRQYYIRKTGENVFTIQGHPKYCPVPTVCRIHGSTWGGSMIKIGWVGRGMYLEFSTDEHHGIRTSEIQDVAELS